MKHVPVRWLRIFQLALLGLDLAIIAIYIYELITGSVPTVLPGTLGAIGESTGSVWAITPVVAALALAHVIYVTSIIWWFDRKHAWLAHVASILLTGFILMLLANTNSSLYTVYNLLLIVFMFFAAMVGFLAVGVVFAFGLLILILSSFAVDTLASDPTGQAVETLLMGLAGVAGSAGWFVFSKRYVQTTDTHTVETLTNVVNQERNTVSLLLESINDGVMIVNTSGTVELINSSAATILGWPKEEAHNLQYEAMLQTAPINTDEVQKQKENAPAPANDDEIPIAKAIKNGQAEQGVTLMKTRDNRQIYLDIAASPIYQDQAGTKKMVGVIAVLRNVDKQKREEQQRTEFISTASHEMRTPVAAIEGYLALALNDKVSGIDAKARSYLEKAHESTQHLGKLFQDLLTSTKAEDGRLSNHPAVVEMGQYLEQLVESLRFAAEKKGLLMEFVIGTGSAEEQSTIMSGKVVKPLYYVHADPDRLREVITNLFDNAVKYTAEGKISIGLTGNNEVVQMYVRDTGPGIPADDVSHLFQKFYRVDSSATRTAGGTGLGLFICRKIVELYKGRIWVESELGKGSTFYVNLPRLSTAKATKLQQAEAAKAATTSTLAAQ